MGKRKEDLTTPQELEFLHDRLTLSNPEKIASLQTFTCSETGQKYMTNFIDDLREQVGNPEGWHQTCIAAEEEISQHPVSSTDLRELLEKTDIFIDQMSPGHDRGHLYRDALTAIFLYSQVKDTSTTQSEAKAALIGGIFHDFGCAITPRHADREFGAGHAETGAYLFWQLSDGILSDNLRRLVCYTIAAHTNYQSDIHSEVPQNYIKTPYWDKPDNQIFEGYATHLARGIDRVDIHSPTQVLRSLMAQLYSNAISQNGTYESGGKTIEMSSETAHSLCLPLATSGIAGQPTAIEHSLKFVANSKKINVYNQYDSAILPLSAILVDRTQQTAVIGDIASGLATPEVLESFTDLSEIKTLFQKVSLSDPAKFEIFWNQFSDIWKTLPPEYQNSWLVIFKYIDNTRKSNLETARQKIDSIDPDFKDLYLDILTRLEL